MLSTYHIEPTGNLETAAPAGSSRIPSGFAVSPSTRRHHRRAKVSRTTTTGAVGR